MRIRNLPGMTISAEDALRQEERDLEMQDYAMLDQDMLEQEQEVPMSIQDEMVSELDSLQTRIGAEIGQNANVPEAPLIDAANNEVANPYTQPAEPTLQDKLQMLKEARDSGRMTSGVMRGAGRISDAVARGYGGSTGFDNTYGQDIAKNTEKDLKEYQDEQKEQAKLDAAERKSKLEQLYKLQESQRKDRAEFRKEAEFNMEKDLGDPNSEISVMAREQASKSMKQPIPEGITAKQLKDMGFTDQVDEMAKERVAAMMLNAQSRARMADSREKSIDLSADRLAFQRDKFGYKRSEDFDKDLRSALKDMRQTATWKASEQSASVIPEIKVLLKDAYVNGGQSLAMLGPKMAKGIANETGVLTDQDVTRYVTNPELIGGLKDTLAKLKDGKISEASYENIQRLLDISKKVNEEKRLTSIMREAQLFTKRENARAEKMGRKSMFNVNQTYTWLNDNIQSPYKDGKAKVITPERKTVLVPVLDIDEAINAGGKLYEPELESINIPEDEKKKENYRKLLMELERLKSVEEDFYE